MKKLLKLCVDGGLFCVELFEPRVFRFSIPRHGHKARSIWWEVRRLGKTTIRTLPVETIEGMKHQRTTVVHKLEHTQKAI
jgi:hypothetical protein